MEDGPVVNCVFFVCVCVTNFFRCLDGGGRKPDLGGAAPTLPRLEPFSPGQVYNWSKAQQVHVLAAPSNAVNGIGLDSNSLN